MKKTGLSVVDCDLSSVITFHCYPIAGDDIGYVSLLEMISGMFL